MKQHIRNWIIGFSVFAVIPTQVISQTCEDPPVVNDEISAPLCKDFNLKFSTRVVLMPGFNTNGHNFTAAYDENAIDVPKYESNSIYNYVQTTTFAENERVAGQSIAYYDELGRNIQNIARDITNDVLVANQLVYDEYSRLKYATLPAAITDPGNLNYQSTFVDEAALKSTGSVSSSTQLGKYYSSTSIEDNMPWSSYPYTSTEYSETMPNVATKSYLAGDVLHNSHPVESYTVNAAPEEISGHPLHGYLNINTLRVDGERGRIWPFRGMTKTISIDAEGKESVSYINRKGNVIATCISGDANGASFTARYDILQMDNGQGYIDIHLPNNITGNYTITKSTNWTDKTINLQTDEDISGPDGPGNTLSLAPGVYRIMNVNNPGGGTPFFTVSLGYRYYSFSVYDELGRVLRTVSPKVVDMVANTELTGTDAEANHLHENTYNSQGWLVSSKSPDQGLTHYIYRRDGKIRFSQNAQQLTDGGYFSYTNYDKHGRIVEVGEYQHTLIDFDQLREGGTYDHVTDYEYEDTHRGIEKGTGDDNNCADQTFTRYDFAYNGKAQKYTRGKVSKTWNENCTTWYSYRYDGLTDWVQQEYTGFTTTHINYSYNNFTGSVEEVGYSDDLGNYFTHYYDYDLDNRLKRVHTQAKGDSKKLQAEYVYYKHGPLKEVKLSDNLQSKKYAYTINGWLKGINSTEIFDPINYSRYSVGCIKDVDIDWSGCGSQEIELVYNHGANIDETINIEFKNLTLTGGFTLPSIKIVYSDNETHFVYLVDGQENYEFTHNRDGMYSVYLRNGPCPSLPPGAPPIPPLSIQADYIAVVPDDYKPSENLFEQTFSYFNGDYSNNNLAYSEIVESPNYSGNIAKVAWLNSALDGYMSATKNSYNYQYDERNYLKNATYVTSVLGENLVNSTNKFKVSGSSGGIDYDANGNITHLQRYDELSSLIDNLTYHYNVSSTIGKLNRLNYITDGAGSNATIGDIGSLSIDNYEYNEIGQLTLDYETSSYFSYDVYGKVTHINEADESSDYYYDYNEGGFRIKKQLNIPGNNSTTRYVRDASGNILATYNGNTLIETPIYGTGRIGLARYSSGNFQEYNYELSDHLGNVRTVFKSNAGTPEILYAADYYPGGMLMPGRVYDATEYRFGYQGQFAEKDDETGYNQFELRLYDSRINRWLTTDPYNQYWSQYLAMGNDWVNGVDPDGGFWGKQRYIGDAMDAGYSRSQARQMWKNGPGAQNLRYIGDGYKFTTRDYTFDMPIHNWWNNHWSAGFIPDALYLECSINFTWLDNGVNGAEGYVLAIRGQQAGKVYKYTSISETKALQLGISSNGGYSVFSGDSRDFNVFEHFGGESSGKEVDVGLFGLTDSYSTLDPNNNYLFSADIGFGAGAGGSIHHKINTRIDSRVRLPFRGRK